MDVGSWRRNPDTSRGTASGPRKSAPTWGSSELGLFLASSQPAPDSSPCVFPQGQLEMDPPGAPGWAGSGGSKPLCWEAPCL